MSPRHDPAHYNLALALLKKGDFERGWPEYEHRAIAQWVRRNIRAPIWDGGELSGKTILLLGEGGFGDTIQFADLFRTSRNAAVESSCKFHPNWFSC